MDNEMSKFDEAFKEPFWFSHGYLLITGKISREEALEAFKDYDGDLDIELDRVKSDRVRFGFPPEGIEDREDLGACWYSGATGKGSQPVWFLD